MSSRAMAAPATATPMKPAAMASSTATRPRFATTATQSRVTGAPQTAALTRPAATAASTVTWARSATTATPTMATAARPAVIRTKPAATASWTSPLARTATTETPRAVTVAPPPVRTPPRAPAVAAEPRLLLRCSPSCGTSGRGTLCGAGMDRPVRLRFRQAPGGGATLNSPGASARGQTRQRQRFLGTRKVKGIPSTATAAQM